MKPKHTLLVVVLLAVSMLISAGCTSNSASLSSAPNSQASAEVEAKQLVVDTNQYALTLSEEWAELAEVSYDGDVASVHLKDHSELRLLSASIVDSSRPLLGGDVGNGCFHRVDLADGRRLEFWSTNWLYILGYDAFRHDGKYDYVGDAGKHALISLTYGKGVELSELSRIGSSYEGADYLKDYYDHMKSLVEAGLELKG